MKSIRVLFILTAIFTLIFQVPSPASAHGSNSHDDHSDGLVGGAVDATQKLNQRLKLEVEDTLETVTRVTGTAEQRLERQKERIQERKEDIRQKVESKKANTRQKLEGRRLATCENRQENINRLIGQSSERGQKRLAVIQKVEEGVKSFVTKKNLSVKSYDDITATIDEREADAIAALDSMKAMSFTCDTVDGAAPHAELSALIKERNESLKDYRSSVIDLIKAVKSTMENQSNG